MRERVQRFSSQSRWCRTSGCDVNHHSKSSLFCPLCVSVATVSYHLEVPHPPDPSNGFSPPSYSFDFGLPCFFWGFFFCSLLHVAFSLEALILSPYCFICFPLSSFFFVLFHFIPCCLLLSFFQSFSLRVFSSSIWVFFLFYAASHLKSFTFMTRLTNTLYLTVHADTPTYTRERNQVSFLDRSVCNS